MYIYHTQTQKLIAITKFLYTLYRTNNHFSCLWSHYYYPVSYHNDLMI